jgi:hypothetical protein
VDDVSQTQSGILAGTPQYMSPEQASGEAVDHRTDLFSLGSVLYAMCTGRSPFRAETTVAVIRRICDGHCRPVREVNPDVPEWLAEIIEKLHEKKPADRFQTAAEVAERFERHLAHLEQPTVVPQPARLKPRSVAAVPVRPRRRRLIVAAAGVALVLLAVGIEGYRMFFSQAEDDGARGGASNAAQSAPGNPGSADPVAANGPAAGNLAGGGTIKRAATATTVENRLVDAEFDELRSQMQELESRLYPREPAAPFGETSPVVLEIERQLQRLEGEMNKSIR